MLTINNLTKTYGPQTLFEDASVQFNKGCRYGIVGANGSGKSTLLKIMTGDVEASSGDVSWPKRARVGTLKQDHFEYEDTPIINVVMMGHTELWNAMVERDAILANAAEEFDVERYAVLEDIMLRHDGYALEARAGEILEGLNIPTSVHKEPLSVLSGGFKLRALLGQVLAAEPDILLLDEPTNHLDILSIDWLELFLQKYRGCAVIVSHDHRFLDTVCTHIVDVDYERVILYTGNYTAFAKAKIENNERAEQEIAKQKKEISVNQAFVDRFKAKASKARQAQSRVKRIEKIIVKELPKSSRKYPRLAFPQKRNSGRQVVETEGISKAYDDKIVLFDVGFTVMRGDRIAIIGPNGIGKSTLLKVLMDRVKQDEGTIEWGYETHIGYFPQDHGDMLGDCGSSTLQSWIWDRKPEASIGYVRGKLAQALFTNEDADKKVGNLSGGESARLLFTGLAVDQPNVLVLDEPTNHLDLEGIEALAKALETYEGTILFVSHDRWFVSRIATRIIELSEDGIDDFRGTYPEFLQKTKAADHLDRKEVVESAGGRRR
ncbi:MAG: ATPase subunit of ABC transporter with duplicated ATPase domains [Myxococcota bacterium]|jgi:ATPase subunit of ABC transporter with duplicated ATPase domains